MINEKQFIINTLIYDISGVIIVWFFGWRDRRKNKNAAKNLDHKNNN